MQLVVNARFLSQNITGVQQYAWRWCTYIKKHIPEAVFVAPKKILHPEMASVLDVTPVGFMDGPFWEQTELPLWLFRNGKPLLLNLGNTAPSNYKNQLVTIHDMATIVHPEWFSSRFSKYYQWLLPKIASSSHAVLTVSKKSASEIVEQLNVPNDKVHVIYNTADIASSFEEKKKEYILAVGSFTQRKNYTLLLDVWDQYGSELPELWIRGDKEEIFNDASDAGERIKKNPKIKVLEPLDEPAIQALYRHARLLVNPSLYEGFGLPNLEAMANGCQALVSDIEVFREVCGEHVTYANPKSTEEWIQALRKVLATPFSLDAMQDAAKHASQFNQDTEGEKLLRLLNIS